MASLRVGLLLMMLGALSLAGGCIDVRDFDGQWAGDVVAEPAVRQGFTAETRVEPLELANVDLEGLSARITTSDGKFHQTPLTRVLKFSNDTMASLTFDGDPLRSYLLYARMEHEPSGWPAMVVVSLFADERVALRIFRGNDLFGVFNLRRVEP